MQESIDDEPIALANSAANEKHDRKPKYPMTGCDHCMKDMEHPTLCDMLKELRDRAEKAEKALAASPTLSTATNRELLQEVLLRCPHLDLKRGKGGMDYLRDCTESVVLGHGFLGLIGPEGT